MRRGPGRVWRRSGIAAKAYRAQRRRGGPRERRRAWRKGSRGSQWQGRSDGGSRRSLRAPHGNWRRPRRRGPSGTAPLRDCGGHWHAQAAARRHARAGRSRRLPDGWPQRGTQSEIDLEAARAECVRPPEALERIGEPPLPQELGAEVEMALGTSTSRFDWHALLVPARHACKLWRVAAGAARTMGRDGFALWVRSTDALRLDRVVIVSSLHVRPSPSRGAKADIRVRGSAARILRFKDGVKVPLRAAPPTRADR